MTWTPERRAEASRLFARGYTCQAVADVLGLARGSVCWAARQYGLRPGSVPKPQPSRAKGRTCTDWTDERLTERWADRRRPA